MSLNIDLKDKFSALTNLSEKLREKKELSLGIDQGTGVVRYVLVNRKNGQVLQWGSSEIAPRQESPEGKDDKPKKPYDQVGYFLKDIAKSVPKRKINSVFINLRDQSVATGNFKVAPGEGKNEKDLIEAALSAELPYELEEASYFYKYFNEKNVGESNSKKEAKDELKQFHFVSVSKRAIPNLIRPVENNFAITPHVIPDGYTHEQLVKLLKLSKEGETVAFINMGRSTTIISIIRNGRIAFERNIPLAGQDLTRAIFISSPQDPSGDSSRSLETSEKIKRGCSVSLSGELTLESDTQGSPDMFKLIGGILEAWVNDISLSLHHFNDRFGHTKISKIYLMGGGCCLKNLPEFLDKQLGRDFGASIELLTFSEKINVFAENESDVSAFKGKFHEYATALALAFTPEGRGDLTPPKYFAGPFEKMTDIALRLSPIPIAFIFIIWLFFLNTEIKNLSGIKLVLEEQRTSLVKVETPYFEMMKWEKFLRGADARTLPASHVLKALSRRIPRNVILTRFYLERDRASGLLEGIVYGDPKKRAITLAEFSEALDSSMYFEKAEVSSLRSYSSEEEAGQFKMMLELTKYED